MSQSQKVTLLFIHQAKTNHKMPHPIQINIHQDITPMLTKAA